MEIKYRTCDMKGCGKKITNDIVRTLDMVFTTETTEGRSVKPYLTRHRIDLCDDCVQKFIDNFPILASGAQGYNEYEWRKVK